MRERTSRESSFTAACVPIRNSGEESRNEINYASQILVTSLTEH